MKTKQNEFLSAVLDDEAGEFERRRLLGELCDDAELGQTLNRYSLVGEAMRSQQRTVVDSGSFLAGIQAQLEDEPVYDQVVVAAAVNDVVQGGSQSVSHSDDQSSGTVSAKQPWHRDNTARYAMAASVAVAALASVLLVQNTGSQPEIAETRAKAEVKTESPAVLKSIAVVDAETTVASDSEAAVAAAKPISGRNGSIRRVTSPDQRTADTLKQYVTLHMQYRSSNGIAPSIQAVSYAQ
ncbi:MAG: Unknown protein [uncultured Thiotrichaceae bacterium]|uniref:Anti sigma-E protein RseA N-terminal domain-containing protein n=1 Tax=uncultured Thiotrichaceae bacterium TaxID=298394 RepID=A0A6S6SEK8_9GAMM|nr:MAG: Unknown protein [uncultured Thiotrichaceae bacterium]